jgi:hypothetical protein
VRSSNTSSFTTIINGSTARSRYQTPRNYETKFGQVIDIESDRAQSLDTATEDRALRRRTLSAAGALQTAGVAAYGRPLGRYLPAQAQSVKSQGVRWTESPDSFDKTANKPENYVSVLSGEVHWSLTPRYLLAGPKRSSLRARLHLPSPRLQQQSL